MVNLLGLVVISSQHCDYDSGREHDEYGPADDE